VFRAKYARVKKLFFKSGIYFLINFFHFLVYKKFKNIGSSYGEYFFASRLIPQTNEAYYYWDKMWNKSYMLFNQGQYEKAVKIRTDVLEEVYEANGVNNDKYFPPLFSRSFSGAIGHLGHVGAYIGAQRLGLVSDMKKSLLVTVEEFNKPIYQCLGDRINLLSFSNFSHGNEPPGFWHLYERLQLIKTTEGFMDHYRFFEKVYTQIQLLEDQPLLNLPTHYIEKSRAELQVLGLSSSDWFVTLHVRETGNSREPSNQSILDYLEAIKFINKLGGRVIRIGDESMPRLPSELNVIDLARSSNTHSHLHLYALSHAKFFIGTTSGPTTIPPLFRVPSLITNAVVLGITTLNFSTQTIYTPKIMLRGERKISLNEMVNSSLGFANAPSYLKSKNIQYKPNSPIQILNGVKEIIQILEKSNYKRNLLRDQKVQAIRKQVSFTTSGLFSNCWLDENADWFLTDA
jgi:putative glycosyltransferase (TIGR04372 family)